ncbi:MAG: hypothetical protein U1E70_21110 [Acetobacteraceae bacterium]
MADAVAAAVTAFSSWWASMAIAGASALKQARCYATADEPLLFHHGDAATPAVMDEQHVAALVDTTPLILMQTGCRPVMPVEG